MFIKNPVKKGGIISKNFTVRFKVIWQVIYVYQKNRGPSTDPWGTPDLTSFMKVCPFSTTLRQRSCKLLVSKLNILPSTSYDVNLNRILSFHTLSKALEIYIKTPLKFISWTIHNNCEMHESSRKKSDWYFVKSWFWWKLLKSSLKMILSYILSKIGRRLIGL